MAITIQQEPNTSLYNPVNNPIEYLVSSNNTSERNFKLSCKVLVGSTEIKELKYDVIPSTAFVIAEIQRLLQSQVSDGEQNLVNEETELKRETDMEVTARAVFQEWYSSNATSNPTYQGSQASGTAFRFCDSAFKYREWQSGEPSKYTLYNYGGGSSNIDDYRLPTVFANIKTDSTITVQTGSRPTIDNLNKGDRFRKIRLDQIFRLHYFIKDSTQPVSGPLNSYFSFYGDDFSFDIADNPYLRDSFQSVPYNNNTQVLSKNYSKAIFENASNWGSSLNLSNITEQYAKYFAILIGHPSLDLSVAYLYELDWNACSKYDSYEIHWLNHLGGWDSWVFDKRSDKQIITNRSFYTQPVTRRIESNAIIHDGYARKKRQFYTEISERYTVNSGILKDWEFDGLIDLLQSPKVYWRHPDYGMIAINILEQNQTQVPRQVNEKAYNLSFIFEIQNQDKLQGQ
jgi:hypothetical protein